MLVISRRAPQRVRLVTPTGTEIWVTVLDVDRGKVRLGLEAPRDVLIHREELIEPSSNAHIVSEDDGQPE